MTEVDPSPAALDEQIAQMAPTLLDHLNLDHNDTLLFVTRVLAETGPLSAATATALDAAGFDVSVERDGVTETVRVEFDTPTTTGVDVGLKAYALVAAARARVGDSEPLTSLEQRQDDIDAIPTFFTQVVKAVQLSPHLRRITFGGGDLVDFVPKSPDQFMYVLIPPPGHTEMTIDKSFTWERWREMPPETQPQGAYYTVRYWDAAASELTFDFVLHGDEGYASAWAARAKPGDNVALWGPRTAYEPPAETEWYLLVGDETGQPGIGAIVDTLPADTTVHAFIEVADDGERQPLRDMPNLSVTWLRRDGAHAGTTTLIADAVRALTRPGGTCYAWGGGESRAMTAVRKYLRTEIGLPREAVSMVGYWRHTDTPHDADD